MLTTTSLMIFDKTLLIAPQVAGSRTDNSQDKAMGSVHHTQFTLA